MTVAQPVPTLPGMPPVKADGVERRAEPDRLRTLQSRFHEASAGAKDRADLIARLARVLTEAARVDILVLARPEPRGEVRLDGLLHPLAGLPELTTRSFKEFALAAHQERRTRVGRIGRPPNQLLIGVPLTGGPSGEVLLALFLAPAAPPDVLTTVVEFATTVVAGYDADRRAIALDREVTTAAALIDLSARVQAATDMASAARILCEESALHLGVGPMAIGVVTPGQSGCRLAAVSRQQLLTAPERLNTALEAALDESLLRGEPGVWPPFPGAMRHSLITHKQLALLTSFETVVSVPLRTHAGEIVGAWVAVCPKADQAVAVTGFMQAAAPLMGAVLKTMERGEKGKLARVIERTFRAITQRKGRWITALLIACSALLLIPLPYSVRCGCEVHPVSVRYVAAPFDARLLKADVEPGDEVRVDQVIATLDGETIRFELAGATAEVDRAAKERDGHLAGKEINAAQMARLDMARMGAKADLLRQRNSQLELRSPVDGVVISGDLRKAEGAPLTMGQTLFEIAPLDEMVLEIGVSEEDIAHVTLGQPVEAVLGALPDRTWRGTVERIHPRSELVDDDYVFVVEVLFQNDHGLLRPGMKGRAKIKTAAHPLGWNLFHKAIDKTRFWIGW